MASSRPSIWSHLNPRRLIPLAVSGGVGAAVSRYKDRGELNWFPDWGFDVLLFATLSLGIYFLWTHDDIRRALRSIYDRWPKLITPLLVVIGMIIGGGMGALGAWRIKQYWAHQNILTAEAKTPSAEQPRFGEKFDTVFVSLGSAGVHVAYAIAALQDQRAPFRAPDGTILGYVSLQANAPVIDAELYYEDWVPPVRIERNQLADRPPEWDVNHSDDWRTVEIVDEQSKPRFQFYYHNPNSIVIKGIFLSNQHMYIADDTLYAYKIGEAIPQGMPDPKEFSLKPLFKYPSRQYPGTYTDPEPKPKADPEAELQRRIDKVEAFIKRGRVIAKQGEQTKDENLLMADYVRWDADVRTYLEQYDNALALKFQDIAGEYRGPSKDANRLHIVSKVKNKIEMLSDILKQLKRRT